MASIFFFCLSGDIVRRLSGDCFFDVEDFKSPSAFSGDSIEGLESNDSLERFFGETDISRNFVGFLCRLELVELFFSTEI